MPVLRREEGSVTVRVEIPGRDRLELRYLLLDVNGTLSDRGELLEGVAERVSALRDVLEPRLLSADTFGTLSSIGDRLGIPVQTVRSGDEKLQVVRNLGASGCVAVGNGSNDAAMLRAAALGVAVVGPEGASGAALAVADLVCRSIVDALDLLRDPRSLAATLRA